MAGEIPDLEHGYYNIDEYQRLTGREITGFSESPMLSGRGLPPVAERLPDNPLVMIPLEQVGRYGGTLRAPNFRPNAHVHMHLFNSFRLIHQPPYGAGGIYWFAGPRLWARAAGGVRELGRECRRPHPYLHDSQGSEVVGRCPGYHRGHRVRLQRRLHELGSARFAT